MTSYYSDPHSIRNLVSDEVRRQLQPSFFGMLFQELRFQNAVKSVVNEQLPSQLDLVLSDQRGLIANMVTAKLPGVLNQQHYYMDALQKQREEFTKILNQSRHEYQQLETEHLVKLRSASDELIRTKVVDVANNQYLLQQIKHDVETNIKHNMETYLKQMEKRINKSSADTAMLSGLVGVLTGGLISIGLVKLFT
jgi:hypothetical protein